MKLITSIAAAALTMGTASVAMAQEQPSEIGGHPNLNGIWQAMSRANDNLEPHSASTNPVAERQVGAIGATPASIGVVEGGKIPYKPEALERLQQHREHLVTHDPEAACYLPGIPRATYLPYSFQIIQGGNDDILMVYEYAAANRVIHMGPVGIPPIDTWMGTSYGEWDEGTLVVTTLAQGPGIVKLPGGEMEENGVTWLDRAGNYLTPTASVVERFTPRGPNHIHYEATITDPSIYERPWTISLTLYRNVDENAQLLEFKCVPFAEVLLYGDLLPEYSGDGE